MRLLLVEDEVRIAEAIKHLLKKNNYMVDNASDGEIALDLIMSGVYDVIILDIMIPKLSGLEVLETVRREKIDTPVIILSAKGELNDRINGLDMGADDYLAKPFEIEELLARINALLRRREKNICDLSFGNILYNPKTLELKCFEKTLELTLKEGQLLELLLRNENIIISKELILEKIWEADSDAVANHVEVYVSFLRKKLRYIDANVLIETKRGIGYRMVER